MSNKKLIDDIQGYRTYDPEKHNSIEKEMNKLLQNSESLPAHEQLSLSKLKAQWDTVSKAVITAHNDAKVANQQLQAEQVQRAYQEIESNFSTPSSDVSEKALTEPKAFEPENASSFKLKDEQNKVEEPSAEESQKVQKNQAVASPYKDLKESQDKELSSSEPEKSPKIEERQPDNSDQKKPKLK